MARGAGGAQWGWEQRRWIHPALEWGSTEGRGASSSGNAEGGKGLSLEGTWTPGTAAVGISSELRNITPFLGCTENFLFKKKKKGWTKNKTETLQGLDLSKLNKKGMVSNRLEKPISITLGKKILTILPFWTKKGKARIAACTLLTRHNSLEILWVVHK